MSEIYWITRLDGICSFLKTIGVISIMFSVIFSIGAIVCCCSRVDEDVKEGKKYCNIIKYSIPIGVLSFLLLVLTPNTKEALIIYGVGGSLEYVKSNEKIKQLPDKCVDAIDMFIDSYLKEEEKK